MGQDFSDDDFQLCVDRIYSLEPKVGKFWQSNDAEAGLYILRSGKVRLLDEAGELITTRSVGEFFGETTLFPDVSIKPYEVRVGIKSHLIFFPADILVGWMERYPNVYDRLWLKASDIQPIVEEVEFFSESTESTDLTIASKAVEIIHQEHKLSSQPPNSPKKVKINQAYFPTPGQQIGYLWQRLVKRYPFFAQQSAADCGVACLVMVSRYWGKQFSVNRLRDIANVDRDGTSLRGLSGAAESIGFSTRPVKASLNQFAKQSLPAIAHWEGKHYVVVYEITPKQVIIGDPAIGQKTLTHKAFITGWTGYVLLLQPTAQFRDTKEDKTSFWEFFELLKPHRIVLAEVLFASILIQIFGLVTPLFTQLILDRVVVQRSELTLTAVGWGLLLFSLFRVAMTGLRQYLLDHTANRIDLALIVGFIRHTLRLPLSFFESRYVGDIISRVQENRKIQRFLSGEALSILLDLLTVFIYLGLMFWYSWQMALLSLAIVPPFFLLALIATPFLQRISREIFGAFNSESSYLIEALTGVRTIKSVAVEQTVRWHWEGLLNKAIRTTFSGQVISNSLQIFSNAIEAVATTVLLWYGAYLVIQNQLTIGQLVAFNMLLGHIIHPFQRLTVLWNQLQEVIISVERINDVLEAEPEENLEQKPRQTLPMLLGDIRFDLLTFRYHPDSDINVLENLSFQIKPGQMAALIGRSGSGKTTISKLVEVQQQANSSSNELIQSEGAVQDAEKLWQGQRKTYQKLQQQLQAEQMQSQLRLKEQTGNQQSLEQGGELTLSKSQQQLDDLLAQLSTLKSEIVQTQKQIQSLTLQLEQRVVRSPANGVIFQLPVKKAQTFVQPGQVVAQIAPQGLPLILKAQASSQQSGQMRVGMPVKLKFDAYPFQDYGVVPGNLRWISPDSKTVEMGQGQAEVFELEITLDQTYIENADRRIQLTPGQSATAETIIRQRRIVDFILDPFRQLQKGGLKL